MMHNHLCLPKELPYPPYQGTLSECLTLTLLSAEAALHWMALSWWTFGLCWPSAKLCLDSSKDELLSAIILSSLSLLLQTK
jgi:hypothetical protein